MSLLVCYGDIIECCGSTLLYFYLTAKLLSMIACNVIDGSIKMSDCSIRVFD